MSSNANVSWSRNTAKPLSNAEQIAAYPAADILEALRLKIEKCANGGLRYQMMNCFAGLLRFEYLQLEGKPKP